MACFRKPQNSHRWGEAASIILYREINADLLAINDLKARGVASAMGVHNYRNAGDITASKGSRYA